MLEGSESRLKIHFENEVSKRIDSLFDSYKLTHEKQWELEHRSVAMQRQIDDLQSRLVALENMKPPGFVCVQP